MWGCTMNQTIIIGFIALVSLLPAGAQNGGTATELIALESRFSQALVSGDWKAVEQIESDDLLFTNADGSVTRKADDVNSLRSADTKFESIDMSDTDVLDLGDVAVVTGKLVEKGRYKASDISGSYRFTDVWARRNGKWQLVRGQEALLPPTLK
jgi:ketosteroid isomerase-like protein